MKIIKFVDNYITTSDFLRGVEKKLNIKLKCETEKVEEYIEKIKKGRRQFYYFEYDKFYCWLTGRTKEEIKKQKEARRITKNYTYRLKKIDVNKIKEYETETKNISFLLKDMNENDLYKLSGKTGIGVPTLKSLKNNNYEATEILYNKILKNIK